MTDLTDCIKAKIRMEEYLERWVELSEDMYTHIAKGEPSQAPKDHPFFDAFFNARVGIDE